MVCQEDLHYTEVGKLCCIHDEGRSLGVAFQEAIPNRPELRRSRAWVVSVREKAEQRLCQVSLHETNENEPLMRRRELVVMSKPGFHHYPGISLEDNLMTDQTASGVEVA